MAQRWSEYYEWPLQENKLLFIAGCCIHDVGKIRIEDAILFNTSKLEPSEWDVMKRHPEMGEKLLLEEGVSDGRLLGIVKHHHERWDGKGYPLGMRGDEIPALARMCSILDAFDAMISDRPYKKGMSVEEAQSELVAQSGIQFDESYVRQFLAIPGVPPRHSKETETDRSATFGSIFSVQMFREWK